MGLGLEIQKINVRIKINLLEIPCVPTFRQFSIFGLNLGKLPNYMRYFGSYYDEDDAESWVGAEISWLEPGGGGESWVQGLAILISEQI